VATPDELEKMLKPLVDAGVDLFDCSTRRFNTPAFAGSNRNLATWTKIVSGKPAMAVGSVTLDMDLFAGGVEAGISAAEPSLENFQDLVNALDAGDFDLVAIGRSLLANPDWVKKVQSGQIGQLRSFTKDYLHTLR
jgi:2,4-dienoyl-CoA reductase-like NADH-dependent reductase (Old Yellow Enzyme family)